MPMPMAMGMMANCMAPKPMAKSNMDDEDDDDEEDEEEDDDEYDDDEQTVIFVCLINYDYNNYFSPIEVQQTRNTLVFHSQMLF